MDERPFGKLAVSNTSQKRPVEGILGINRPKRAKYASAACNECKRCKVKCIQFGDDPNCQRCATMHIPCVVAQAMQATKDQEKQRVSGNSHYKQLSDDVASLRQELTALTATVKSLLERVSTQSFVTNSHTPDTQPTCRDHNITTLPQNGQPKEPQFVGPTRSAFSLNIAETALTRMGISTDQHTPTAQSSNTSSREPTPEPSTKVSTVTLCSGPDCLLSFSDDEVARLIGIYQEEVVCCHPIIDTDLLVLNFPHMLELVRHSNRLEVISPKLKSKDIHMLRIVIATAITTEPQGKSELYDKLIAAVEQDVGSISSTSEVELKDIQIMAMLSIYFCHVEEELLAWRAIGRAAQQCLEMGLHRKQSLVNHFTDADTREFAIQVFWVVYELDRRWSFGTSLSFALDDRDIDAKLPEPDGEHLYFKCMVSYARLCSRVWEELPPYGSSSQWIPKEMEDYLDFVTQNWLLSIPQKLQFRHPRLGLAPSNQPRILHRLRTLCYLRGNYMRLLIHRHHVLNPDNVKADMQSMRLVVEIAKDSIEVLVHLNGTSDIYVRQQPIYHFYLLSGLAILLLAVCHAPSMFAETCRDSFESAVELVKGFSRNSSASRRLWKSIRSLLPVIRSLGGQEGAASAKDTSGINEAAARSSKSWEQDQDQPQHGITGETIIGPDSLWTDNNSTFTPDLGTLIPDIFDMSNNLIDLYNAFGSTGMAQPMQPEAAAGNSSGQGSPGWEMDEISRHFQGLI